MKSKSYILTLLSCLIGSLAFSQTIEFVENKGQWDTRTKFIGQVSNGAFFIHDDGFTVLQHNAEDMQRVHDLAHARMLGKRDERPLVVRSHAYNVQFLGASESARISADKPLSTYNNYFLGNDPTKWGTGCRIFQGITINNIYPNIDIRYYTDNNTLKYDFIVRPGGKVSDIALKYAGADRMEIRNKELQISTTVGELKELAPYIYQYNEKGKVKVNAKYQLKNDVVRFDVGDYDPNSVLVIDPTLIFCSFSGSTADNWGFTATYGPDGSMYGGGIVFGNGFFGSTPAPGAFQTSFGGGTPCLGASNGFDIGLIKLSPNGNARAYATYLGGSGSEMPQSLIVDPQGNLIVAGRTNSPKAGNNGAFPVAGSAGQVGVLGGWDIIITKFNATGSALIGSVRIGGSNDDGANISACSEPSGGLSLQQNYGDEGRSEVNLDPAGNVYVASCTQSNNFPINGGFQGSFGGGLQDGAVIKLTPNLSSILFSSYFGGSGNDATYVVSISPGGSIYVAGGTESGNLFPATTGGTIGPNNHGNIDGFVAAIASDGSSVLKATYLGTGGIDQVYGIQFDRNGFPYVMGQTSGSWPVTPGVWSTPNGRQFIAKLRPDLSSFVYSTVFGKVTGGAGSPDISPVAFLVDRCENVYVSGWGGQKVDQYQTAGVQGLPTTAGAIKNQPDLDPTSGLGRDFYFFVLKKNATSQLYGSFFGQDGGLFGDHVDGGTSRFDENGVIYQAICASCGSNVGFPTTPGAWSSTKPSGANCNLAMVKIAFNLAGVGSGVQSFIEGVPRDTAGCVPLTVDFKDTVLAAVTYEWNFGDSPAWFTTTIPEISHTYTAVGTYHVTLVAVDSSTCNIRDTSYMNIKVGITKAIPDFVAVKLNPCDSFKYRFDNLTIEPVGHPFKPTSFIWNFGDGTPPVTTGLGSVFHNYATPGTRTVKLYLVDTAYCNAPDSAVKTVNVASLVKAGFKTPSLGCAPYNAKFTDTSHGGTKYTWDFGDGSPTSNLQNPTHLYNNAGVYIITLIVVDSGTCNITDTARFTITVYDNPVADFSWSPQPPLTNVPVSFTNLSSTNAVRFKWLFGDGDSLLTTSRNVVQHEYNKTGTWNACLIAYNQAGCADTLCRPVEALIDAAVDVPNAFTPGQAGVNSILYVRGFGIAKLKFAIYARYGTKVFETGSKLIGWDGKYKGKDLPMDVYAYTLDVEFTDGTKARRTGDITLIR